MYSLSVFYINNLRCIHDEIILITLRFRAENTVQELARPAGGGFSEKNITAASIAA